MVVPLKQIAQPVNVGRQGQFWLLLYNQVDLLSVLKKHLVIGQFYAVSFWVFFFFFFRKSLFFIGRGSCIAAKAGCLIFQVGIEE